MAKSSAARPPPWGTAIRWGIGIFVLIGLAGWFLDTPDPHALQRERSCRFWGITDQSVLARCRSSSELESAAIEPFKRSAIEREIAEFNQDLAVVASGKTHALAVDDYPIGSIDEVAKDAGGILGLVISTDPAMFPSKGRRVKLSGVIITHEPDPDDSPDERISGPRYFTLDGETHRPDTMPETVNLDIESLNRYERQFIVDHCHFLSVTPCRATVLAHIDEIVGRRSMGFTYIGIVADQIDIEPLDWSRANPEGMPSMRMLMEISKGSPSGKRSAP